MARGDVEMVRPVVQALAEISAPAPSWTRQTSRLPPMAKIGEWKLP
jgi:hypothetical protein